MSRRDDALAAAVQALGEYGLHGLTHRKVDKVGGLPAGTTSNYFTRRIDLLVGVVDHLVNTDLSAWEAHDVPAITTPDGLIQASAGFVSWALSAGRPRSIAQIALLEASIVEPELKPILRSARDRIEAGAAEICGPLGIDPLGTMLLLDATDAIIFRQLAIPAEEALDPEPYFRTLIGALTG